MNLFTIKQPSFVAVAASCPEPGKRTCGDHFLAEVITEGDRQILLLAVSDGVSTCSNDALASRTTCEQIVPQFRITSGRLEERLQVCVTEVNDAVMVEAGEKKLLATLVLLAWEFHSDTICWLSIGDSRLYRRSGIQLEQLSKDDTVRRHVKIKGIDRTIIREMITKSMGTPWDAAPAVQTLPLTRDAAFVLASDGWHSMFEFESLMYGLLETPSLERETEAVYAAFAERFEDDATFILLRMEMPDPGQDVQIRALIQNSSRFKDSYNPAAFVQLLTRELETAIDNRDHDYLELLLRYMQEHHIHPEKCVLLPMMDNMVAKGIHPKLIREMGLMIRKL